MSIIIMILLLSFLVLIHEAGHYCAAKAFGIKVERFGFGLPFGPTLFKKKIGETTFYVHALLLGGYVMFPDDDKDSELPLESNERFENKPIYQKAIVVSAGVIANVLCAYFLVLFSALVWHYLPSGNYDISVGNIVAPKDAPVHLSGMKKGDRLVSLNGTRITNAYTMLRIIQLSKTRDGLVDKSVADANFAKLKELNPAFMKDEIIPPNVTIRLPYKNYVKEKMIVLDKKTASGLKFYNDKQIKLSDDTVKMRDYILEHNNNRYYVTDGNTTLYDVALAVSDNVHPLNFVVERNGQYLKLKTIYPNTNGVIGVQLNSKEILNTLNSFPQAVADSAAYLWDNTYALLIGLEQVCTGKVPLKDLHGIVAITKVGGDIISNNGLFYGLLLTALISMDLAIVNFLPIPALDGGQLLFIAIEKFIGKKNGKKVLEILANISFFLLIALMLIVVYNDILAIVTSKL